MDQVEKARRLAALHVPGKPLALYNAWDAGSAKAVQDGGAPAVGTSSWAVAAAQGWGDGEQMPLDALERATARIAATLQVPLTVDVEGGYAVEPGAVAGNVARLLALGVAGINLEDRVVGGGGLHGAGLQSRRIRAVRGAAEAAGIPLFVNARTDLFLSSPPEAHAGHVAEALERARAYADAGASGLFVPGLADEGLVARVCGASPLPVNVMVASPAPDLARLAALGVARVSFGPVPYLAAMAALREAARALYQPG